MNRILIVEDDASLLEALCDTVAGAGYEPLAAADGTAALEVLRRDGVSLVLTDVRMPGLDGHQLLREIRALWPRTPVLVMTAFGTIQNAVAAMREGAADYLVKPFLPDELLARVESVLRRTYRARQPLSKLLRAGTDVIINPASHEVFMHGNLVALQPAEYSLLVLLAERPGEVVSINAIADALGISEAQPRRDRVKWHVWKLRQAIEDDPKHPKLIATEPGHGYRLEKYD